MTRGSGLSAALTLSVAAVRRTAQHKSVNVRQIRACLHKWAPHRRRGSLERSSQSQHVKSPTGSLSGGNECNLCRLK